MDYIGTMSRGWQVAWNNKYLWILGFLAALGSGKSIFNFSGNGSALGPDAVPADIGAIAAGMAAASCVGLFVAIGLWLVSLAARGGLIEAVARDDRHKPVEGFGQAFRLGWGNVWRLAGLSIVLYGIIFLLFLGVVLLFTLSGGAAAAVFGVGGEEAAGAAAGLSIVALCFLSLLCLMIPLFIFLSFIYPFAMRGMVLRDLGVMDSIRHGWRVLVDNLGAVILLAFAFLIFNVLAAIVTAMVVFVIGLTAAIPLNLLADTNATFLQGIIGLLAGLAIAAVSALIWMFVVTWQSSTFTLAYLEFTGKDIQFEEI